MRITIPGVAKPQGSKNAYTRGGRTVLVESSKLLKPWRLTVAQEIKATAINHDFNKLSYNEAANVSIFFYLPRPKSVTERKRYWHTVKPDIDKLTRAILDAITLSGVIWVDDSQVVNLHAAKHYALKDPYTVIVITRAIETR